MYFNVNFNLFFKLIKMHLLVRKLYITEKVLNILDDTSCRCASWEGILEGSGIFSFGTK